VNHYTKCMEMTSASLRALARFYSTYLAGVGGVGRGVGVTSEMKECDEWMPHGPGAVHGQSAISVAPPI
jgi:hypothetical protein